MAIIDVFNGDADGICALTQLRNADPQKSTLITGVKRDIQLLNQVHVNPEDQVTVLDISLDKNREPLNRILGDGANVFYVDHHFSGKIPVHKNLTSIINTASDVCTSILVNNYLKGQFVEWAIAGAFGDNLKNSAQVLAKPLSLTEQQLIQLEQLGIYINYNGYGSTLDDLHFSPQELYQLVSVHKNPFEFINEARSSFEKLQLGYQSDMSKAGSLKPEFVSDEVAVYILPNESWARRVSGVYSNDLANAATSRAHAVLTKKENGNYLVSIRAPLENKIGADEFCRGFATGGGRAAAAGINDLAGDTLSDFIDRFKRFYKQ